MKIQYLWINFIYFYYSKNYIGEIIISAQGGTELIAICCVYKVDGWKSEKDEMQRDRVSGED